SLPIVLPRRHRKRRLVSADRNKEADYLDSETTPQPRHTGRSQGALLAAPDSALHWQGPVAPPLPAGSASVADYSSGNTGSANKSPRTIPDVSSRCATRHTH